MSELLKPEASRRGIPSPRLSRRKGAGLSLFCALALAGCNVGPNFRAPEPDAPGSWIHPVRQNYPSSQPAKTTSDGPADVAQWWKNFNDPLLDSLIDRSISANLDLRQAASRLREARATFGFVAADEYPQIGTSGSYARSASGAGAVDNGHSLYRTGLDASWELDIFGGIRRNAEAARADIDAAVEDRRDVLISVVSEVAIDYVSLRGYQRQLEIARGNLEAQKKSADLTRRLFAGGFNSRLDVANSDALVATTASTIPVLETQRRQTMYSIAVLLAEPPGELIGELSVPQPIPIAPPNVPVGLPSELLRRRPDVRRAVAQLHAATARIGAAEADLYPRFSLTGEFGFENPKPASLLDYSSHFWSFGPAVSWPLFDGGRIRANIAVRDEVEVQAVLSYRASMLTALNDVENALVAYAEEQEHRAALADAVDANRQAVALATQLYTQGQTDFLNVLTAQRSLFSSEDSLVASDRSVVTDLITVYKALGGGWEEQRSTH